MIINNLMMTAACAVSFLAGVALTALICTARHSRAYKRLATDMNAYLENETKRVEHAEGLIHTLSALTAQTGDTLTENTKLLRVLRNIVDPKTAGASRKVYRRSVRPAEATEKQSDKSEKSDQSDKPTTTETKQEP